MSIYPDTIHKVIEAGQSNMHSYYSCQACKFTAVVPIYYNTREERYRTAYETHVREWRKSVGWE